MDKHLFQQKILSFYAAHGRDLPWRRTTDRYAVLVSEIMLQQTQVHRVIPKYEKWLEAFPSPSALAAAPLAEVLTLWSGLGYNNRAKRLQDACKIIAQQYDGIVPGTPEALISLPGIGPYTARSVLIFADNAPLATVDTNIRRILIHEFGLEESVSDHELFTFAQELVPKGKSRDWHNALMDYGASELTARKTGIRPKSQQSSFKDSKRFYRGAILRLLIAEELTEKKIKALFPNCPHNIKLIINQLKEEGLIEREGEAFRLPQ